jgi:hypothetical protein
LLKRRSEVMSELELVRAKDKGGGAGEEGEKSRKQVKLEEKIEGIEGEKGISGLGPSRVVAALVVFKTPGILSHAELDLCEFAFALKRVGSPEAESMLESVHPWPLS